MKLKIQQWMMKYLRKKGWVVFNLAEEARECPGNEESYCWLSAYKAALKAEKEGQL